MCSSLQFLCDVSSEEVYGEASGTIVAEAMLESATLENRKKLLPRRLLSFFLFLCHACSHMFKDLRNFPRWSFSFGHRARGLI